MRNHNDPNGAAQQTPPEEIAPRVHKVIEEEVKKPEPPQTVHPTGGAAMSATSVDTPPRVNQQPIVTVQQSADTNQTTLLTVEQLNQILMAQREHHEIL